MSSTGTAVVVNWSVNGVVGGNSTIGTIDQNGNFTAPASFPSPNSDTVTATLQSDSTKSGSATVMIVYPNDNAKMQTVPIKLGTSGGNSTDETTKGSTTTCCSGTLGSLVSRAGVFLILSNNHVLDKSDQGTAGQAITQPGLVDTSPTCVGPTTTVATLTQAAALKPNPCSSTPCTGPAPSNVDAAIAQIVLGAVDTTGSILDLGAAGSTSIAALPPSSTLAVPANVLSANEQVAKSGRSTGLTCSNLSSIMTTVSVAYTASCGGSTAFNSTFSK